MQGFLIARPMPFQDAITWLSRIRRVDSMVADLIVPEFPPPATPALAQI
jgi:hypothetical protein